MEIVIDIPEMLYEKIQNRKADKRTLETVILRGKPLPEHHGRLIDADALEKKMCDREEELGDDRALWESSAVSVALDMFAPTIIEASRGE